MKYISLKTSVMFALMGAATSLFAESQDVKNFGAKADGAFDNTAAIQAAIDKCSATGGGEVIFSETGTYMTSTFDIKDNVCLNIPVGTILKGNPPNKNYRLHALVAANKVSNIGITGGGIIDGNGASFEIRDCAPNRARLVSINDCKNVKIENITLQNPATWTLSLGYNDTVIVKNVKLFSICNFNNDGIDIASKNVVISDSIITCDDDGICIKNMRKDRKFVVENITVKNCVVASNCNAFKIGTETWGDIKNITVSNCVVRQTPFSHLRNWNKKNQKQKYFFLEESNNAITGIAIESVDGAQVENIAFSNMVLTGVQCPLFIRVGHRNKDEKKSAIRNVVIKNVIAKSASCIPNTISSIPEHTLENVVISDSIFDMKGCVDERTNETLASKPVPENIKSYPEVRSFGIVPAYGFYMRHAKNITVNNVQVRYQKEDFRAPFYCDDIDYLRIMNCKIQPSANGDEDPIVLKNVKNASLKNNSPLL